MANWMLDHIETIITELRANKFPDPDGSHVYWIDDREEAFVTREADPAELHIPRIRSKEDYATAPHEIGHICGRYQKSAKLLTRERWAWDWADENALQWTPIMEREALESLRWCAHRVPPLGVARVSFYGQRRL